MRETKVITGKVRASYVNVFETIHNEMSKRDEYSMTILIPKSEVETVRLIKEACKAAIEKKWGAKPPQRLRNPLRDADAEASAKGVDPAPGYAEHFFVKLKTYLKPGIVTRENKPVTDTEAFMSGDYCRVSITAAAYDTAGNAGVSFWLNNIQVLERGEPLGRSRAEDEFGNEYAREDCPFD